MSGSSRKPVRQQGQRNNNAEQQEGQDFLPEDLRALSVKTEIAGKYAPFMQG
jgi:hypothetical protein